MTSNYDKIREENIREYGKGTRHLSFLGRLYTDRTHFIFELLQNAEDAGATRIRLELFEDRLEVKHNGRSFNEHDVRGVCGVGEGTKAEDLTQIGKFGIGFKSVYAYTSTPQVHSGDESFRIENYVRPFAVERRRAEGSWTTIFVFAFDADGINPETAYREIGARLCNLSARTLLFLRKIKEIEYRLADETSGVYLREEASRKPGRQVTVIGQNNGEDEDENWLVFEKTVPVPDSTNTVKVEVAFRLDVDAEANTEYITRTKDTPLVVYFPTEKPTRFGFFIQGPYRTTPSRDNIPKDDNWNAILVEATAVLLPEALLGLKEMGLLTVTLLEALPIRMDDFPEDGMFFSIVSAIRIALKDLELLPADDGTFVAARSAKLARGVDLRKLVSQNQLRSLFQSNDELKWLAGTITQDRTPDLRAYLLNELYVEEVNPDGFARRISGEFLQGQSDEWMISFYRFVGIQKALWKPRGCYRWDPAGPLRERPFIRIQDGSHVKPFRNRGDPNAYLNVAADSETSLPTVKAELLQDDEVYQFLNELGIPEVDLVAEVIENIVPKYKADPPNVSTDEHKCDFLTIERAYATDSQEKKWRLRKRLLITPFILSENPSVEGALYRRSREVYFRNDELRMYFSGNDSIAWLSPEYAQSAMSLLTDLGVRASVRVRRTKGDDQGYVLIENSHGKHERGIREFDPNIKVDGLEIAISDPTLERSAFIWNRIAIPNSPCIRGVVEKSSRQTYEYRTFEDRTSGFGGLLIDSAWLPGSDGRMHKPNELALDDLPESFDRDESLADQLYMKKDVVGKLADEAGVPAEDIEILRQHPEEFKQWKATISAQTQKPAFPERASSNPERRREKLAEQLDEAPNKKYEQRDRSVRTTRVSVDPALWLRSQYKNEFGQMICQICEGEMPFIKRDGEYHFETVEALSKEHFPKEQDAQFLALCPLCAAMYKEFVKRDEQAMLDLKNALMNTDKFTVPLRLGKLDTGIRFVERHYHDIKTILDGGPSP